MRLKIESTNPVQPVEPYGVLDDRERIEALEFEVALLKAQLASLAPSLLKISRARDKGAGAKQAARNALQRAALAQDAVGRTPNRDGFALSIRPNAEQIIDELASRGNDFDDINAIQILVYRLEGIASSLGGFSKSPAAAGLVGAFVAEIRAFTVDIRAAYCEARKQRGERP